MKNELTELRETLEKALAYSRRIQHGMTSWEAGLISGYEDGLQRAIDEIKLIGEKKLREKRENERKTTECSTSSDL